ncbi:MAG: IspD/TarI family cytidylyltransferase [Actinomycetales bacterium]
MRAALVLLAGGSGTRMGSLAERRNKVYLPLGDQPVLAWSLRAAAASGVFDRVVLVSRKVDDEDLDAVVTTGRFGPEAGWHVQCVHGGASRHGSELNALRALTPDIEAGRVDVVAIHDGARPLAAPHLYRLVVETAARVGGAVPTLPPETLLPLPDGTAESTGSARRVEPLVAVRVQTPQAFRAAPLLAAYEQSDRDGFAGDDTADCVARYTDCRVVAVPGSRRNLKVTHADDLALAERLVRPASPAPPLP